MLRSFSFTIQLADIVDTYVHEILLYITPEDLMNLLDSRSLVQESMCVYP